MHLETLWLTDFRSYADTEFSPAAGGITVVTGANGAGKTNLIEAIAYLATLRSLRGSPGEAMVRSGCSQAVVRAALSRDRRSIVVAAELNAAGRDRVQVNGQPLRRTRDLLGALQVTVFSPDDLVLVKSGPAPRREYLDDLLVAVNRRHAATLSEVERILKQRNALLKSAGGFRTLPEDVVFTLDVWDSKLAAAGEELARARESLVAGLEPLISDAYLALAAGSAPPERRSIRLTYRRSWAAPLAEALAAARADDLRRGVTTTGPHRDELELVVGDLPARTHASQGEQRTLALALRLAGHRLVTDTIGSPPVLLLDDVFSELDHARAESLLHHLPTDAGQAILTTAGDLPAGGTFAARFRVEEGKLLS